MLAVLTVILLLVLLLVGSLFANMYGYRESNKTTQPFKGLPVQTCLSIIISNVKCNDGTRGSSSIGEGGIEDAWQ